MKRVPLASGQSLSMQEDDLPAIAGGAAVRPSEPAGFGAPVIGEAEIASVVACLRSHWIGLGARVEQFEHELRATRTRPAPPRSAVAPPPSIWRCSRSASGRAMKSSRPP